MTDNTAWRLLKPFKGTSSARVRFLDTAEQNALLNAADGALRRLVAAALMTGARFGELSPLRVSDFDPANGSIFIAKRAKAGNHGMSLLNDGGLALFTSLVAGRPTGAFLLTRDNGKGWRPREYSDGYRAALRLRGSNSRTSTFPQVLWCAQARV